MTKNYVTFSQRLKQIIANESLLSFAKKCNLSESAIRKYLRDESEPTLQNLLKMAEVGNVSVAWLATGHDPFLKNDRSSVITMPEYEFSTLTTLANHIDFLNSHNNEIVVNKWVVSREWLSNSGLHDKHLVIVKIPYNNMDDTIKQDDMVIANLNDNNLSGVLAGIYIIHLNNKLLIKRIQYDPVENGYHLTNDNSTYKNHFFSINESMPFKVIAQVRNVLTKIS